VWGAGEDCLFGSAPQAEVACKLASKPDNTLPVGGGADVAESKLPNIQPNGKPELPKTNVLVDPAFDIENAAVQLGVHEADPTPGTGMVWPRPITEILLSMIC
jgi:hypothetical protein